MRARTSRLVALCSGVTISSSRPLVSSLSARRSRRDTISLLYQPLDEGYFARASTDLIRAKQVSGRICLARAGELLLAAVGFDKPHASVIAVRLQFFTTRPWPVGSSRMS